MFGDPIINDQCLRATSSKHGGEQMSGMGTRVRSKLGQRLLPVMYSPVLAILLICISLNAAGAPFENANSAPTTVSIETSPAEPPKGAAALFPAVRHHLPLTAPWLVPENKHPDLTNTQTNGELLFDDLQFISAISGQQNTLDRNPLLYDTVAPTSARNDFAANNEPSTASILRQLINVDTSTADPSPDYSYRSARRSARPKAGPSLLAVPLDRTFRTLLSRMITAEADASGDVGFSILGFGRIKIYADKGTGNYVVREQLSGFTLTGSVRNSRGERNLAAVRSDERLQSSSLARAQPDFEDGFKTALRRIILKKAPLLHTKLRARRRSGPTLGMQ